MSWVEKVEILKWIKLCVISRISLPLLVQQLVVVDYAAYLMCPSEGSELCGLSHPALTLY